MAKTITLTNLRLLCRERADMVNSQFVSDAELDRLINHSADELYDLILNSNADYAISSTTFTISSGDTQALPSTFYRLRGVDDLTDSSNPIPVRRFNFAERNDYNYIRALTLPLMFSNVMYSIVGANIQFTPPELAQKTYKLWYNPVRTDLASGSDTFDGVSGWDEYIAVDAAIKMLTKEESSTTALERAKQALIVRITHAATLQDVGEPQKIVRIRGRKTGFSIGHYSD